MSIRTAYNGIRKYIQEDLRSTQKVFSNMARTIYIPIKSSANTIVKALTTRKNIETFETFEEKLQRYYQTMYPDRDDDNNALKGYSNLMSLSYERQKLYQELDDMDDEGNIISVALNIYASECTQRDINTGLTGWYTSPDKEIEKILNDMLKRINFEQKAWGNIRSIAKYGGNIFKVIIKNNKIMGIESGYLLADIEEKDGRLEKFIWNGEKYDPINFIQFKISNPNRCIYDEKFILEERYGSSMIAQARKKYRQLYMLETAVILWRLSKRNTRVYNVFVGNSSPEQAAKIVKEFRTAYKKKSFFNPITKELDYTSNPLSTEEDIFWAKYAGDRESSVTELGGSPDITHLEDIELIRKQLSGLLGIPNSYWGFESDVNARATLAEQNIQIAMWLDKLQRAKIEGMVRLGKTELKLREIDITDKEFSFNMSPVSDIQESKRIENMNSKMEVVEKLINLANIIEQIPPDKKEWVKYVLKNYLKLNDEEVELYFPEKAEEPEIPETPEEEPEEEPIERNLNPELSSIRRNMKEKRKLISTMSSKDVDQWFEEAVNKNGDN